MKVQTVDLSNILRGYSNTWLALNPDSMKVVATGREPKTALEKARKQGVEDPILTKAPKDYGTYIL